MDSADLVDSDLLDALDEAAMPVSEAPTKGRKRPRPRNTQASEVGNLATQLLNAIPDQHKVVKLEWCRDAGLMLLVLQVPKSGDY